MIFANIAELGYVSVHFCEPFTKLHTQTAWRHNRISMGKENGDKVHRVVGVPTGQLGVSAGKESQ